MASMIVKGTREKGFESVKSRHLKESSFFRSQDSRLTGPMSGPVLDEVSIHVSDS